MSNEPVAYINVEERRLQWAGPVKWDTPIIAKMDKIPLYTHPVKEQLTDEDLEIITEALLMVGFMDDFINYDLKEKALTILRKASEK